MAIFSFESIFLVFLLNTFSTAFDHQKATIRTHYKAAVVEYQPEGRPWEDSGPEIISKNLANYLNYILNASLNEADLIVFPEYGLTTLGVPRDRDSAKPFLLSIPSIGRNPCEEAIGSLEIQNLSCAAKSSRIYVIVNTGEIRECIGSNKCPEDGVYQYNTNVVFDRDGVVVAKYEKANLYFEDQFDKPDPIQLSTFTTDFGVDFGLFTCFDIIFFNPSVILAESGVRNFIFPTAWVDELPFLTAIQAQSSWAHGVNGNLLASGYHQPLGGQLGSGIYVGVKGAVNYTFDSDSGSQMLIGELPISPPNETSPDTDTSYKIKGRSNIADYHSFLREDLQNYTTKILNLNQTQDLTCTQNGFCCELKYQITPGSSQSEQHYRLIAFNDSRTVAAKTAEYEWQVCAVIRCFNASLASCSENDKTASEIDLPNFQYFELRAEFDIRNGTKFMPMFNGVDVQFDLIPSSIFSMTHNVTESSFQITSHLLQDTTIKTVALINKIFDYE